MQNFGEMWIFGNFQTNCRVNSEVLNTKNIVQVVQNFFEEYIYSKMRLGTLCTKYMEGIEVVMMFERNIFGRQNELYFHC